MINKREFKMSAHLRLACSVLVVTMLAVVLSGGEALAGGKGGGKKGSGDIEPTDLGTLDLTLQQHVRGVYFTPSDRPFPSGIEKSSTDSSKSQETSTPMRCSPMAIPIPVARACEGKLLVLL